MNKSEKEIGRPSKRPKYVYIGCWRVSIEFVDELADDQEWGHWKDSEEKIGLLNKYPSSSREGTVVLHEFLHAHSDIFGHDWGNNESNMSQYETLFQTLFDPRNREFLNYLIRLGKEAYDNASP